MKDHEIAKLVNDLREVAIEFHGAQQLRERIAQLVVPAIDRLKAERNDRQAKIDMLMLEYCPGEMTIGQFEEWGKRQQPASAEHSAEIDAALGITKRKP